MKSQHSRDVIDTVAAVSRSYKSDIASEARRAETATRVPPESWPKRIRRNRLRRFRPTKSGVDATHPRHRIVRAQAFEARFKPSPSRGGLGGDGAAVPSHENTIPIPAFPLKGKEKRRIRR